MLELLIAALSRVKGLPQNVEPRRENTLDPNPIFQVSKVDTVAMKRE
jgi:hypothetical protein